MSQQLLPESATPSDPELIAAVRAGDSEAYGLLFERHRGAAMNLARQIAGQSEADDLVSEAFIKVMRVLQNGGGPDVAFRAYLLTAVRRLHVDRIRAQQKVTPSDDLESFDPGVPFVDPAVDKFENAAAAKAFASLPERWQLVLWHLEVEGQKPADVAPLLGLSANSVSALAYRAREGLRQAYLQMHMADTASEDCQWTTERLGAHVRKGLSKRDAAKVDEHLDECAKCSALYLELAEVNSNLSAVIGPVLLGSAAAAYLGGTSAAGAATGITGILLKLRHVAQANTAATASGVAAGVVAVGVSAAVAVNGLPGGADTTNQSDVGLSGDQVTAGPVEPGTGSDQTPSTDPDPSTDPNPPNPDPKPDPTPGPDNAGTPPVRAGPGTTTNPTTNPGPGTSPDPSTDPGPGTSPDPDPQPDPEPEPTPEPKPEPEPPVVDETPNPEDDDPPVENPDDPGVPVVTDPEPPNPTVDVGVTGRVTDLGPFGRLITLQTSTADPASSLVLTLNSPNARAYRIRGWDCSTRFVNAGFAGPISCATTSTSPGIIQVWIYAEQGQTPTLTASVTAKDPATGLDNLDPNSANNSFSYPG